VSSSAITVAHIGNADTSGRRRTGQDRGSKESPKLSGDSMTLADTNGWGRTHWSWDNASAPPQLSKQPIELYHPSVRYHSLNG